MSGTRLMSDQRPSSCVEAKVVIPLGDALAGSGGYIQRENKLPLLSCVVEKRWSDHVWCRLLGCFGRGSNANACWPIRQSHDFVLHNYLLYLFESILVKRQNSVSDQLLFLQFSHHLAIVARRQMPLLCNLCRYRLHLGLNVIECVVGHCCNLTGWNVDAIAFQFECVLFRRQSEISASLGQHICLRP